MLNVNFEAMKKKILKILEEGKKYGYNNEAIANELLNLHNVSQQRELLISFMFWYKKYSGKFYSSEKTVDNFLKYKRNL